LKKECHVDGDRQVVPLAIRQLELIQESNPPGNRFIRAFKNDRARLAGAQNPAIDGIDQVDMRWRYAIIAQIAVFDRTAPGKLP
jgi:hypothetical protein